MTCTCTVLCARYVRTLENLTDRSLTPLPQRDVGKSSFDRDRMTKRTRACGDGDGDRRDVELRFHFVTLGSEVIWTYYLRTPPPPRYFSIVCALEPRRVERRSTPRAHRVHWRKAFLHDAPFISSWFLRVSTHTHTHTRAHAHTHTHTHTHTHARTHTHTHTHKRIHEKTSAFWSLLPPSDNTLFHPLTDYKGGLNF
jgi:hypothetical protein